METLLTIERLADWGLVAAFLIGIFFLVLIGWRYVRGDNSPANAAIVAVIGLLLLAFSIYPKLKLSVTPTGEIKAELERAQQIISRAMEVAEEAKVAASEVKQTAQDVRVQFASEVPEFKAEIKQVAQRELSNLVTEAKREIAVLRPVPQPNQRLLDPPLLFGTVLFDLNRAELSSQATHLLTKLAEFYTPTREKKVAVVAYADPQGSEAHNQSLSDQRAQAVKSFLTHHGIASKDILITAKGEIAFTESTEKTDVLYRRADVYVLTFEPGTP